MWSSVVTHPFTHNDHHHAGAYCGSHHHIAGFHSDSVSSSVDHLKPAENESHSTSSNQGGFLCIPAYPWSTAFTRSLKSTAISVWSFHTEIWFMIWAQVGVLQHVCMTIKSFFFPASNRSSIISDHKQASCLNGCPEQQYCRSLDLFL